MKLNLSMSVVLVISMFLLFPLQTNALNNTSGSDSANLMMLKKHQLTKEALQARKEEFKNKLQELKDQKKRMIIERIDTRMASINKKTTTRLSGVLERLQSILNKIIEKAGLVKAKGVDTAALDSATVSAQLAINNARTIVASQSAMVYVIQIASESALRENVGSTVSQLRMDLRDTHKAVIDAKQAVYKAAMELAKFGGQGIFKDKRATNSAATSSAQ